MADLIRALITGLATFFVAGFALRFVVSAQAAIALGYLGALLGFLIGIGGFRAYVQWLKSEEGHELEGWRKYFMFSVDHKVIGIQYLVISLVVFVVSGLMAMLMRLELAQPGLQYLDTTKYNTAMGLHGIGMVIVALIALVGGIGNFAVPLLIGAKDMAFPRLNAMSFWILPPAVIILLSSPLAGGFDFGWTAYPPLSVVGPAGKLFFILAFISVGFSSIFGGVNFVATIFTMRAPGMSFMRMPIFVWSILAAGIVILLATSIVAGSLIMVLLDRAAGTTFFDARYGGDALLYQHLFWYYSHPAVYIMVLPALGVVLEILPVFSRKPLFAYRIAALSFMAIVVMSFIVWAHHLYTSGMWDLLTIPFMVTTELISVPTGVVFLSALGTLWLGKIRLRTPMLFAIGFLLSFLIGGLTGIFLADVPTDIHLHDSWFVVAHFHYTIVGGTVFALFAAIYYWFPKMTGKMLNETLGKIHFWLFFVGFQLTFIPMFWLGTRGMRRRVADFPPEFGSVQLWISLVTVLMVAAVAVFLVNFVHSWRVGEKAPENPWDARTLEWQIPSPPPHGNFDRIPTVTSAPYGYGRPDG